MGSLIASAVILGAARQSALIGADLSVYREAGRVALSGGDLYAAVFGSSLTTPLPFTYPPFAAILFVPISTVSLAVGFALMTAASTLCVSLLMVDASHRSLGKGGRGGLTWPLPGWFALGAIAAITPMVADGIFLGQVSLILACLVYFSTMKSLEKDSGGILVGLAAATKLTPAIFVVLLAATARWRSTIRASVAFAACLVVGFAAGIATTINYFGAVLLDPSRVGGRGSYQDISVAGVMIRSGAGSAASFAMFATLVAGLLCSVFLIRQKQYVLGVLVLGVTSSIGSPIAWSHHAVWVVPLAIRLWILCDVRGRVLLLVGAALLVTRLPLVGELLAHANRWGSGLLSSVPALVLVSFCALAAITVWRGTDAMPSHSASRSAQTDGHAEFPEEKTGAATPL